VKVVYVDVKLQGTPQAPWPAEPMGAAESSAGDQSNCGGGQRQRRGRENPTLSVNLACSLKHLGQKVGLLDCDIYGPSIPLMMGINQKPTISEDDKMVPPSNHGVKLMSMGFCWKEINR